MRSEDRRAGAPAEARWGRWSRRLAAAAFAATALVAGSAAPAAAAGPPVITYLICEHIGRQNFICDAAWTGGTDPETVSWVATNGLVQRSFIQSDGHSSYASGFCNINKTLVIQFTVSDATGATDTAVDFSSCRVFRV